MSFSVHLNTVDQNAVKVSLEGELIVREADAIHKEFIALLSQYTNAQINLDGVSRIDIAGFQLLAALKKSSDASRKSFTLCANTSESIRSALSLSGFTHLLSTI